MPESSIPTPYAVHCTGSARPPDCYPCTFDLIYLTKEAYDAEMADLNSGWHCPRCGSFADWDDDNYKSYRPGSSGTQI